MGQEKIPAEVITRLLHAWRDGDKNAFDRLVHLVYDELKTIASLELGREFFPSGLQTTELLHKALVRLIDGDELDVENRKHFFHSMARAMHHLLIDEARKRKANKHGGSFVHTTLDNEPGFSAEPETLLLIDEALTLVEEEDPGLVLIVKMRYFAGFTIAETATLLDLPVIQVNRRWSFAKAWLKDYINKRTASGNG